MFTVYQYSFFFFLKAEHALSSQRKTFSYTNLKQRHQYRAMFILYPTVKKEKKKCSFSKISMVYLEKTTNMSYKLCITKKKIWEYKEIELKQMLQNYS